MTQSSQAINRPDGIQIGRPPQLRLGGDLRRMLQFPHRRLRACPAVDAELRPRMAFSRAFQPETVLALSRNQPPGALDHGARAGGGRKVSALPQTVSRFAFGSLGPISVSGAHFFVQIVALKALSAAEFGLLALLLVVVQFGYGLSNALIGTPYTVNVHRHSASDDATYFALNFWLGFAVALGAAGLMLLAAPAAALATFVFGVAGNWRWFGRSHVYARQNAQQATWSDFGYSATLMLGLVTSMSFGASLEWYCVALALAALVGLLLLPPASRRLPLGRLENPFAFYLDIWREQSRWTVLGVITTEASSNAYAWLTGFLIGPHALAPIAAASLFFRPLGLATTSLTQLERAEYAKRLAGGDKRGLLPHIRSFKLALAGVWALCVTAGLAVFALRPGLAVPQYQSTESVMQAFGILALTSIVTLWRSPESVLLQAAGRFRSLGLASTLSALAGTALSIALLFVLQPHLSVLGALAGQVILARAVSRAVLEWRTA